MSNSPNKTDLGRILPDVSTLKVPRLEVILGVALFIFTAFLMWFLYSRLSFTITNLDVWFDSDSLFVFDQITNRASQHNDTNSRHPIFSIMTYPLVFVQTRLFGIDNTQAALTVLVLSSSLCVLAMYVALRLAKRPVSVALIFTAIFIASTAGLLFLGIHERLIPGCISILLCIIAFLLYERHMLPVWCLVIAAAASLGVTVTNFIVGIAVLLLALGLKRGSQATANAILLIFALSSVNSLIFSGTHFGDIRSLPFSATVLSEKIPGLLEKGGTPSDRASVFWIHALVLPEPAIETKPAPWSDVRYLSVQKVGLNRYSPPGYIATSLWLPLIGFGLWQLARKQTRENLDILLAISLSGQFLLCLFFGSETILYSPYYVPLLLLLASKPWPLGKANVALLTTSGVFLLFLVWNNIQMFNRSLQMALSIIS